VRRTAGQKWGKGKIKKEKNRKKVEMDVERERCGRKDNKEKD
jgi:hypothetical protein